MQVLNRSDVANMVKLLANRRHDEWFPISVWKSGNDECTTFCQYSEKYDNVHVASCLSSRLDPTLRMK